MTVATTSGSAFTTTVSGTPSGARAYTLGEGLLPLVVEPTEDGIVLFQPQTVTVTRYRYRAGNIATPWATTVA